MTDDFVDPGEPGELKGRMKATDLINKPLIIRPLEVRDDGKGTDDDGNPKAYTYVDCDVWVLDRAGIVEKGEGVRISWTRVMPQLENKIGQFVAGKPVVLADNSRVLQPFTEEGKETARKVIGEIKAESVASSLGATEAPKDALNSPELMDDESPF